MSPNVAYIVAVINSTIRSTTPIIFASLGCLLCSRCGVFNIALEGQMLIGCFVSIAVNSLTHNALASILAGTLAGGVIGALVAQFQVKWKAADAVIGTAVNLLVGALTTLLLLMMFGVRGSYVDSTLVAVPKITIPFLSPNTVVGGILENLTILDYGCYLVAILTHIYLFKSVSGFRLRSIGINKEASISMGQKATQVQMLAVIVSGMLCGIGGCAISMGQVRMFTENMTSGRGYIAMAATSMGADHPLLIILSSLFFGAAQAVGVALQQTVPSQLTMAVPYAATVAVLCITGIKRNKKKKNNN